MPTPGSHAHDLERSRRRRALENQGVPYERAEEQVRRMEDDHSAARSPAAASDRAAGPYGEGGGGDPGAVMELRSPAFSDNAMMPPRLTKTGQDLSPALEWSPPPEGTVELALLCEDRDAPGGNFTHWLVTGIEPAVTSLEEGTEPLGAVVWPNSFGERRYGGPLPPPGDDAHRYFFRVFALEAPLRVEPNASTDDVGRALDDQRIAAGTLVGLFVR
jgi:hypothetical protein